MHIVCLKWTRPKTGAKRPGVCDYTAEHVNTLNRMVRRHSSHDLVCVTDDPAGVECATVPLWDKCLYLGGCYNRLYAYSDDMRSILGGRFALMDLDCVITGNIDHLFEMGDFAIHRYSYDRPIHRYSYDRPMQHYNGSLVVMDAGARRQVWREFNPATVPPLMAMLKEQGKTVGTDQAWVSYVLGDGEQTIGPEHGVHEALKIKGGLPTDARLVFFSGPRDPSQKQHTWIAEHYR